MSRKIKRTKIKRAVKKTTVFDPAKPTKPAKGEAFGECNRTACSAGPAIYFNKSTRKHYCVSCAMDIQEFENTQPEPFCLFEDFYKPKTPLPATS